MCQKRMSRSSKFVFVRSRRPLIFSLGTIAMPSSAADRIALWNRYTSSLPRDRRLPTNLAESSLHAYLSNVLENKEEKMSREQSLRNGAGLMVLGALIFVVYAVVFFFRAFASSGFEIGVETLNGVTPQQLDGLNPAIMGYITHLHVATAGFIAATAIAAGGLAWYGVRDGLWWAWIIAVVVPVVGLALALPMHYMGHFNYDWMSHLGPIYLGTIIYVVGAVVALVGLTQGTPTAAQARR